ncbi:MAG TPA: HEAT repeat domain-containing protein [Roseiflexaceae bacterium]|nr:HEAT repeat domain-containing protein [Roseiflexaceae bacterium]
MAITSYIREIGAHDHKLAMRDLKPLSGLGSDERDDFWPAWSAISPRRRAEIARSMVDLAEDDIDLDFGQALSWLLEDEDAEVRASAVEGLWEDDSTALLRRLLKLLRGDPAPTVRAAVAMSLSRFAYQAELEELEPGDAKAVHDGLLSLILDQRQPLDVRRRALESAGYFASVDEIQHQIELAYASDEQLMRESALAAMGRSMLPRWLPTIGRELEGASPALRYEAARAAGEMAEEARQLLPKLSPLLNDRDSEVVLAAIWALGQIGGETAKRLLQQVRKSEDETRRQAAADALEELSLGESLV